MDKIQEKVELRKAITADIPAIQYLINNNLDKVLPRTDEELLELIDTLWIVTEDDDVVGCCCLEVYSAKIAEIRSLTVRDDCRGKGYGSLLVNTAVEEAKRRNIRQILVVTSTPEYFEGLDFGTCLNEKYALFWHGKGHVKG